MSLSRWCQPLRSPFMKTSNVLLASFLIALAMANSGCIDRAELDTVAYPNSLIFESTAVRNGAPYAKQSLIFTFTAFFRSQGQNITFNAAAQTDEYGKFKIDARAL